MRRAIAIMLLMNCISCLIVRAAWAGKLVVNNPSVDNQIFDNIAEPKQEKKTIFLIAGLFNQPREAFSLIEISGYERVYLEYSPLGYNPKIAGKQIAKLIEKSDVVCGISVGAKAAYCSAFESEKGKYIFIDPCIRPSALKQPYKALIKVFSPIASLISIAMGWLSCLPIIPADMGNRYSIALVTDQLLWIGYGDKYLSSGGDPSRMGIIISSNDEFLERTIAEESFQSGIYDDEEGEKAAFIEYVNAMHSRIGETEKAPQYEQAIGKLLTKLNNTEP